MLGLEESHKAGLAKSLLGKLGDDDLARIAGVLTKSELAAFFDAMPNPGGYAPLTPARARQVLPTLHLTPESQEAINEIDPDLLSTG